MSTPRSEFATARVVTVATAVLTVGLLLMSAVALWGDFQARRDQRSNFVASSEEALAGSLDQLETDLSRSLAQVALMGADLADRVEVLAGSSQVVLGTAVNESEIAAMLPALDRVLLRDSTAQIIGVDRFGSRTTSPAAAGFDGAALAQVETIEPFADNAGSAFVANGIAAYFPIGEEAERGWLALILRADVLAVASSFDQLVASDTVVDEVSMSDSQADLVASVPFLQGDFVATRTVPNPAGDPPGWLTFILRVVAATLSLIGVVILGRYVRKNYVHASERLQSAKVGPFGSSIEFEQNITGIVELDDNGVITGVNQAYCEQVQRERTDLIGTSLLALTEPADRTRHLAALDKVLTGAADSGKVEHRVITEQGSEVWVLEHLLATERSGARHVLVQSQDITFRRYATWELAKQALHDELTGLPNRAMLVHRLRTALEAKTGTGEKPLVGAMFIDIDRFKKVNDSLGHEVGDRLIKHVGSRIETAVRAHDTVSRFGGDEFVVLCDNLTGITEAVTVAERIRKSLSAPYLDEGATIHPTLSIGIAVAHAGDLAADELLRDADAAMYKAKERGRNRVEVFDEGIRKLLVEHMTLESELIAAIDNEQVAMYFQPIVDSVHYATAGFESLVRWPHPTRGLLTPGQFLGVAEEAGLVDRLDMVALKKTCAQMALWASRYPLANELYVSANKVPKNFPQFVQHIREVVASTGLPAGLLVIEVVENALIDDADGALEAIESLKEMGVRVAIDDFGTGYSSLSYLTQFRPTTLKIDRAFVSLLPDDAATGSVVRAITEMALALDINVIAEGVETWEQAEALHRMGVPYFQGYLFAKPRPAEEIERWFIENQDPANAVVDVTPRSLATGGFVRRS